MHMHAGRVKRCPCTSILRRHRWLKGTWRYLKLDFLNVQALLNIRIHRDIPIDISVIIDEFARRHPQRLQLSNIFSD